MYLALASGMTITVWAILVICYAVLVQKTETPEYKIVREYIAAMNRENEHD